MNTITAEQMRFHLATGQAIPLLPDGIPGPVHHAGRWWLIPEDAHDYQPADDARAAQLDEFARRLAAGTQALQTRTRADHQEER
ncbi:hypothetical protein REH65_33100 (plasmid) [Saccharopolyspora sp. ID03-671]|uniref:hypothetical protein n=1 Tax=Saccharopolyspora sp. ID03-671 TaxID=3073066 RepID=UPI0030F3F428